MELAHDERDEAIVAGQLGRMPRGRWAVARRCHLGIPMVIENHPLSEAGPFPTLFWLTCPLLVKRVSRQEAGGRLKELTDTLALDSDLRSRISAAGDRLIAKRDAHAVIDDRGNRPGGGPDRIKCLHAHTAQELADPPNPVGALALAEAGWPDCRIPCVQVRS